VLVNRDEPVVLKCREIFVDRSYANGREGQLHNAEFARGRASHSQSAYSGEISRSVIRLGYRFVAIRYTVRVDGQIAVRAAALRHGCNGR
jgi:hypothetical protein